MNKESNLILGLKLPRHQTRSSLRNFYSDEQKIAIIEEYLSSGCTKREIWEKYTGQLEEHGIILRWMREFGYEKSKSIKRPIFSSGQFQMNNTMEQPTDNSFENIQLTKRIEELEKQLKDAEMKAIAYSTMVDLAEKEFNISIRKKSNTKPSKK